MKKTLLALSSFVSISSAEVNSCDFNSLSIYEQIDKTKNTVIDLTGEYNFYNNLKSVSVYKNGRENNINKNKLGFSHGDFYYYDKNKEDLCVLKKIDYNYKKFVENGYLEYLKELSGKYNINYNSMLAIFKEETGFNDGYSGGFGRMTNIAIEEVNRFFNVKKGKSSETRELLVNNQKLAIKYSVLYFYIMLKRYKGYENIAVKKYNGNMNKADNGKTICTNYVKKFEKNYKLVLNY